MTRQQASELLKAAKGVLDNPMCGAHDCDLVQKHDWAVQELEEVVKKIEKPRD